MPLAPASHDVFISYANVDNVQLGDIRWVTRFCEALGVLLGYEIQHPLPRIWMDPQIAGNEPLTSQLLGRIDGAHTILCVLSSAYFYSEWCKKEWQHFLRTRLKNNGQVFMVLMRDLKPENLPQEIRELDLPPYRFFTVDSETKLDFTVGGPLDKSPTSDFFSRFGPLVRDMAAEIRRLRQQERQHSERPNVVPDSAPQVGGLSTTLKGRRVYLAEVTDDLLEARDAVRGVLEQHGATVLPKQWYAMRDPANYRVAAMKDIENSELVVQLLGMLSGRKSDEAPLGLPGIQFDLAIELAKQTLRWRSDELDPDRIKDADWKSFVTCHDVIRSPLGEFQDLLVKELTPKKRIVIPKDVAVYINSERSDREVVQLIRDELAKLQVMAFAPAWDDPVPDFTEDWRNQLLNCHGVMYVYGHGGKKWLRAQLAESLKVLVDREVPPGKALCDAPPEQKPDLDATLPNFTSIRCVDGIDQHALSAFVESLR